jgi:hypothetical protein
MDACSDQRQPQFYYLPAQRYRLVPNVNRCAQEILLHGSLRAGEHFSTKIGNGLELRLLPMRFSDPSTTMLLDGWRLELVPTEPAGSMREGEDRIYPLNLPLRFARHRLKLRNDG